mgnify:FL=1
MIPELYEIDLEYEIVHTESENPTSIVKHIPTGLSASCNYERSWMYNRKIALGMLTQKVHDYTMGDNNER